ncbi:unnamed protein product, partial [Vitis vinifera]|uniref:Uncharacterized protein n=1 Tax=Vitis vinifera TaxID=29760 RepID=D7STE1_VITVI
MPRPRSKLLALEWSLALAARDSVVLVTFTLKDSRGKCLRDVEMGEFHWHLMLTICLALATLLKSRRKSLLTRVSTIKIWLLLLEDTPLELQHAKPSDIDYTISVPRLQMALTLPWMPHS